MGWEDQSSYHHSLGEKIFEDEGQMLDPAFTLVAEVQRLEHERSETMEFRDGATVRFHSEYKTPVFRHNRF